MQDGRERDKSQRQFVLVPLLRDNVVFRDNKIGELVTIRDSRIQQAVEITNEKREG